MSAEGISIVACSEDMAADAVRLLVRFFREEGFDGRAEMLGENLRGMLADPNCWIGLAVAGGDVVGIATVTAMRDIEHGRLSEIGDLYVLPEVRNKGVARRLIAAAIDWCRQAGCRAILVTVTPQGDAAHGLAAFYRGHGFAMTDRMIARLELVRRE
jgi:GNAT superfamily N-acetyltransferase